MRTLEHCDLSWCVARLPKFLRTLLESSTSVCIAGGYIRACIARETVSDIDLFVPSKTEGELLALKLADGDKKAVYETENAFTVRKKKSFVPLQVIHRWTFERPELVVPSFDFTIARAAIWYDLDAARWTSLCDDRFYTDLASRRLVYCQPERNEDAGGSILRVLKFYQRGYRIPLDSLGAVIGRLVNAIDFDKFPESVRREEWISGIVTGLLREVDPSINLEDHHEKSVGEPEAA